MAGVSGGRQRTRTNCRGVPSAGLSCVADVSGCPRTVTDRSGQYMPADRPSSLTDLVATGGAKPLKQRKRPESYSKPAQESSEASYSSSIWLYSTRTERGERNGRFCIGFLHLLARRTTSERLGDKGETASKKVGQGLEYAVRRKASHGSAHRDFGCEARPPAWLGSS